MAPLARAEGDGARVILILDASGSMRAKINGKAKIDIAKEVVGKIISTWNPADELGLVAYGHREKGSCEDIEVLRQPGKLDAQSYMDAVNKLSPKGKTPMTAAVRMAAEALQYTEQKATIILVSDGIETCGLDPCAVAEELAKSGVGFVVHTVGFGLDDKAAAGQLKCLADKTGGISIIAENADELEKALARTVKVAGTQPTPAPPPEPADTAFTVAGHVRMAADTELHEPFLSPSWEFKHAQSDGTAGEPAATEYGTDIKSKLEPGNYIATVTSDAAAIIFPVSIEAGKTAKLAPSLEAGVVNLSGKLDANTPAESDTMIWEILLPNGSVLATKYGSKSQFMLNAGNYSARLSLGIAQAEQAIAIAAGKSQDVSVILGAGKAEVSAVYSATGPGVEKGITIEVRRGEADADGSHPWIATLYDPLSRFDLPAGKYLFTAASDYASAALEGEIKAGQTSKIVININAGYLDVKAPGAGQIVVFGGAKAISGARQQVTYESGEEINKVFSAGSYHLVSEDSNGNPLTEKDFEVKAGGRTEGTIP